MVATAGGIGWLVVYRRHSKLCRWASFDGYFVNRWKLVCWHRMDDDVEICVEWMTNVGVDLAMSVMLELIWQCRCRQQQCIDVRCFFSKNGSSQSHLFYLFVYLFISLLISHRM